MGPDGLESGITEEEALRVFDFQPFEQFACTKVHGRDPRRFALGPMPVGHGKNASIGQYLHPGVRAVPAVVVVHQTHPAPSFGALNNVVPRTNPCHPVALTDGFAGGVSEANHQVAVLVVPRGVAITGEGGGQGLGLGPRATFIGTEDH